MKPFFPSVGFALGVIAIAATPEIASARSCQAVSPAAPSVETRAFMPAGLGLVVNIPSNYRSILRSSGHITFHDPHSFEFIQCLVRTGEYGAVTPYASLEVHPGVLPSRELIDIVRSKRPWVDYYSPDFVAIEAMGRPAIQYEYTNEIYGFSILNISFLSTDGNTLLTLSGPAQNPIMQNASLTLALDELTVEATTEEVGQE
ncbi:MAG: hypothetical protein AAGH78_12855 [Cyanobacteria bacterium P01_H01_bin.58]